MSVSLVGNNDVTEE